jgi:hypothetical protein
VAEHATEISKLTPSQESANVKTKNEEILFDSLISRGQCIVKFVPPGQSINEKFYLQVLAPREVRIVPRQVNPSA